MTYKNHSGLIARLGANIEILQELDPEGDWQHNQFLLCYLRDRYSLLLREAEDLDVYLTERVQQLADDKRYKQLNLLSPTQDNTQDRAQDKTA